MIKETAYNSLNNGNGTGLKVMFFTGLPGFFPMVKLGFSLDGIIFRTNLHGNKQDNGLLNGQPDNQKKIKLKLRQLITTGPAWIRCLCHFSTAIDPGKFVECAAQPYPLGCFIGMCCRNSGVCEQRLPDAANS